MNPSLDHQKFFAFTHDLRQLQKLHRRTQDPIQRQRLQSMEPWFDNYLDRLWSKLADGSDDRLKEIVSFTRDLRHLQKLYHRTQDLLMRRELLTMEPRFDADLERAGSELLACDQIVGAELALVGEGGGA